jgi:hypothetical protein
MFSAARCWTMAHEGRQAEVENPRRRRPDAAADRLRRRRSGISVEPPRRCAWRLRLRVVDGLWAGSVARRGKFAMRNQADA